MKTQHLLIALATLFLASCHAPSLAPDHAPGGLVSAEATLDPICPQTRADAERRLSFYRVIEEHNSPDYDIRNYELGNDVRQSSSWGMINPSHIVMEESRSAQYGRWLMIKLLFLARPAPLSPTIEHLLPKLQCEDYKGVRDCRLRNEDADRGQLRIDFMEERVEEGNAGSGYYSELSCVYRNPGQAVGIEG